MAEVVERRGRGHNRRQSMMAQQFSAQLDDLFKIDNGLDSMVQDVEQKRQSVFFQTRELEELQERIRAAEARLGRSDSIDSNPNNAQPTRRPRGLSQIQPSVFAIAETDKEEEVAQPAPAARGPGTQTPQSTNSNEYVVVRRPRPGAKKQPRVDSHVESEESEDKEDSAEEGSEGESSEEGEDEMVSSSDEE